jgi:alkylation response protein AidB-like acyl-CoA dehydrogenase
MVADTVIAPDQARAAAERTLDTVRTDLADLPLPGSGGTGRRFDALARVARRDVTVGRLAEAHADAVAILAELGGQPVGTGRLCGVWAADPPSARPVATPSAGGRWVLDGTKAWCSGAGWSTDALVTAHAPDGYRLFAVDLDAGRADGSIRAVPGTWPAVGMADSDSRSVTFTDAPALAVGGPGAYLTRPGFWHGAVGVAAAWLGAAEGIADALDAAQARRPLDEHALAHVGAVATDLAACRALLDAAAVAIDADPDDESGSGFTRAMTVRAAVEAAATRTIDHVGRALGPAPLAQDGDHGRRVADLTVYLRQSHAERDLAALAGALVGADRSNGWRVR